MTVSLLRLWQLIDKILRMDRKWAKDRIMRTSKVKMQVKGLLMRVSKMKMILMKVMKYRKLIKMIETERLMIRSLEVQASRKSSFRLLLSRLRLRNTRCRRLNLLNLNRGQGLDHDQGLQVVVSYDHRIDSATISSRIKTRGLSFTWGEFI